ncbi:MAG: diguanylate cyclase [Rhodoferax sp.]|uniref:GGDEF domain-containing protein n=1 Tax=Rhodoferax sp. TaxID=50421 RepID=UPI00260D52AC|nr:diguanylate cyclase [Rhodoferax sp.]MDD2881843.1 diguanylate cyclase [Rhodoferax sp.]
MRQAAPTNSITLLETTSREDLHHQLYRYAQDLQDLMGQHVSLQQRHQQVLESLGSGEAHEDMLLKAMLQPDAMYLATNRLGEIEFISPAVQSILGTQTAAARGLSILAWLPAEQLLSTQGLLEQLGSGAGMGAIHQRKLDLQLTEHHAIPRSFNALVMQVRDQGQVRIYWMLDHAASVQANALDILKTFPFFETCAEGLTINAADATIYAVNHAMTHITGHAATELQGENPSKLGAGLQDAEFHKIFWRQLNSNGHWSGTLFNRRKSAEIFFSRTTVKAVKNDINDTICYLAAYDDKSSHDHDHDHDHDHGTGKMPQLTYHDPLTGLPNRRLLEHRLTMTMADPSCKKTGMYVLLLELSQLLAIEHKVGADLRDQVLREVSERLKTSVRRADTVARLDGGVFVILLPGVVDRNDAESVANAITIQLNAPFLSRREPFDLGIRFGGAAFPRNGDDVASVFRHAEAALRNAKHLGARLSFSAEQLQ